MKVTWDKFSNEWATVDLQFETCKDNEGVQNMKIPDEQVEKLEEHHVQTQNTLASCADATFENEVLFGHEPMSNVAEVSGVLSEVPLSGAFFACPKTGVSSWASAWM